MSRYKQPYSLTKRGKYYYYRTYTVDGVRTTAKTTGQTSKARAKEYCDNLYLKGTLIQNNQTFENYAQGFFDDDSTYIKDRIKPLATNSKRIQKTNLNNHLLPRLGNLKLTDIKFTTLKNLRIQLLDDLSPNTTIGVMGTLQTIMNYAYKDGLIQQNPFDFLDAIERKTNLIDAFSIQEIREIYHDIKDSEFQRMILLMAITGTRIGECVGLEKEDVKDGEGFKYIDLKRQFNRKKYIPLKWDSARKFPIIPEVVDLIGFQKGRFSPLYRAFYPLKSRYETGDRKRLCFHSLRHFFITNTLSVGIPESKVNYFTGHRQKGINQIYINYKPDDMLEFLEWQKKIYKYITE